VTANDLPPRWIRSAAIVLALLGLAVSAYLTFEHLTASTTLACPDTGRVDCAKVTSSTYSTVLGVPVAFLGLAFFLVLLPLLTSRAWGAADPWVHRARLVLVGVGLVFVLYLVWAELFRISAVCLWCTGVHLVTAALFALVVFAEAFRVPTSPRVEA
jgi:uncharacterized membrane protein